MATEHPAFPNPTITEALCEIHFELPEGFTWSPAAFGQYFAAIQSEFPVLEPVPGPQIRMRYRHASRPLLLQLSENMFTVNVLPKYTGWQQMMADIAAYWSTLRGVIGPTEITRVGLRYINFVPIGSGEEQLSSWFAPNRYVAEAALQSRPSSSKVDVHIRDLTRVLVTLGEVIHTEDESVHSFVLDIDAITSASAQGPEIDLLDTVKDLHDNVVWEVFNNFRSPRLTELLNKEKP